MKLFLTITISIAIWVIALIWLTVPLKAEIKDLNYQLDVMSGQQEEDHGHINVLACRSGLPCK